MDSTEGAAGWVVRAIGLMSGTSLDGVDVALSYSFADGAATLSALTGQAVGCILPHLPAVPKAWIIAGGGARNRTLMKMLQQRLSPATVETADQAGWSSDALEAQAFAYLAVHTLNDLPITFPKTTGVKEPLAGGVVARP